MLQPFPLTLEYSGNKRNSCKEDNRRGRRIEEKNMRGKEGLRYKEQ
jgi:hypothetical protein